MDFVQIYVKSFKWYNLKTSDAIIALSAKLYNSTLITLDKKLKIEAKKAGIKVIEI